MFNSQNSAYIHQNAVWQGICKHVNKLNKYFIKNIHIYVVWSTSFLPKESADSQKKTVHLPELNEIKMKETEVLCEHPGELK